MDALPIQELNQVSYKSGNDGVMHACGHDAHVAILMGVAEILMEMKAELPGTVKLLFQPNEEGHEGRISGAQAMIDDGALQNPRPSAVFGLHVTSNITSRQIALATARLSEGARDPKVGDAIRRRSFDDARSATTATLPPLDPSADDDRPIDVTAFTDAEVDRGLRYLHHRFPAAEAWQISATGRKPCTAMPIHA